MNSKKFVLIFFIFFLLSFSGCLGQSSSTGAPGVISSKFSSWWVKWSNPVKLAFSIMILITVFAWLYGHIFQKEEIKAFTKAEILNLIYSALILVFVFSLLDSAEFITAFLPTYTTIPNTDIGKSWIKFVQSTCEGQSPENYRPCHIKIAQDYLEVLSKNSESQIIEIIRIYNFISLAMSFSVSFKFILAPGTAVSVSPFIGLTPVGDLLSFSYDILVKNLIILKAQQIALDLMHIAFFPYMLSFGLFLRVFHFTRKLGGLLIALAVCFYIVLPLLYVFWCSILFSFTGPWDVDLTKARGFVSQIYSSTPEFKFYSPNKDSPDYSEGCNNGIISPNEECNEYDKNSLSTNNSKILNTCPPRDQDGKILPGREKDIYCNYNNCRCVSQPFDYSLNIRKDMIKEFGEKKPNIENLKKYAQICFDQQSVKEKSSSFLKEFLDLFSFFNIYGAFKAATLTIFFSENGILHSISKIFIFSIFAPFISLMATLAGVKVLSTLFGGDAYIAGISRLI